jgi:hypothetical protein
MNARADIQQRGGLAHGLALAADATHGLPLTTVPWTFVPIRQLDPARVWEARSRMGPLVLRWSVTSPDEFTSRARRGDKARQINRLDGRTLEEVAVELASARLATPPEAAGAVLQQAIDFGSGCLFDVEIVERAVDFEFRTPTARLLVCQAYDCEVSEPIGEDPRLPGSEAISTVLGHLRMMARRLAPTEAGWHVEGGMTPSETFILQIRPVPSDRPTSTPLAEPAGTWDRTRYVWGSFDVVVDLDHNLAIAADGQPVTLFVRELPVDTIEEDVHLALATGQRTLVLNRAGGFRLTHEPANLPASNQRDRFLTVHLRSRKHSRFRIVSDGSTAYFTAA